VFHSTKRTFTLENLYNTAAWRVAPIVPFVTCATALAVMLAVATPQANDRDRVSPPPVPVNIQPPAGNRAFLMAHAIGTQNYMCLPLTTSTGTTIAWVPVGPQATLFNEDSEQVLTHFLSPNPFESGVARATWQHSRDTSAAWGLSIASSSDPHFVAPGAIPWLLLRVVGAQEGPTERDRLEETTFIQRVNTTGGIAPPAACVETGTRAFVPYTADYIFYKSRGHADDQNHDHNHD
jgi:hypothetical protein